MKRLLLICLTVVCATIQAQYRISVHSGMGTFQMKSLKQFQHEIATSAELPVALKQVSSFPYYYHFGGSFVYDFRKRLALGAAIQYGSSGARYDYHDYSGYIQSDLLTSYWQLSFSSPYRTPINSKYSFIIDGLPGITLTNLNLKFNQQLGTSESSDNIKFHSVNVHMQPTLMIVRGFGNFEAGLYSGYYFTVVKGKLLWSENKEAHLLNNSGDVVQSDWTGVRAGVQISYRIE